MHLGVATGQSALVMQSVVCPMGQGPPGHHAYDGPVTLAGHDGVMVALGAQQEVPPLQLARLSHDQLKSLMHAPVVHVPTPFVTQQRSTADVQSRDPGQRTPASAGTVPQSAASPPSEPPSTLIASVPPPSGAMHTYPPAQIKGESHVPFP